MSLSTPSSKTLFGIAVFFLAFFLSLRVFNTEKLWKHIVTSDGRGYYAYLPALLIDHDPAFSGVIEREKKIMKFPEYRPGYIVEYKGKPLNKYFAGEALLLLPFFLIAMLFSWITAGPMDGYSFYFQFFTGIGSLFYLICGLIFLRKILKHFSVSENVISISLIAIAAATNIFYYSLWQPTMSHIFSFFAITAFLRYAISALKNPQKGNVFATAFFLAILILIRPTNFIVVLVLPLFSEDMKDFFISFTAVFKKVNNVIIIIVTMIIILMIQPVLWYIQTGDFLVWSYRSEGFHFRSPQIMSVLFSFRKGLFVYTPFLLLSVAGVIMMLFRNRFQFLTILIFLICSTWVVSSWWSWYYGDGFGLRAFIDYYGIFAIPAALFLEKISFRNKILIPVLLTSPFIFLNLFQTWQYSSGVIHPNSMNREKYKYVFLRADSAVISGVGGIKELPEYRINMTEPSFSTFNDFEKEVKFWDLYYILYTGTAFSGTHAGFLNDIHPYSPGIKLKTSDLGIRDGACYLECSLMIRDSISGASNRAMLVLSMDSIRPGENYWQGIKVNDVPVYQNKEWRKCSFSLMLPPLLNPKGILKLYIWNPGGKPLFIDDFNVRFYTAAGKP